MASPFLGDCSEGMPQPSITTRRPQEHHNQPSELQVYQDVAGNEPVVWIAGRTQASLLVGRHGVGEEGVGMFESGSIG